MASVADNVNELMKTKNSEFSAEKLNGNIAKQLLVAYHLTLKDYEFKKNKKSF